MVVNANEEFMLSVIDPCLPELKAAYLRMGAPADLFCTVTMTSKGLVEGYLTKTSLLDDMLSDRSCPESLKALILKIKTEKKVGYMWCLFSSENHGVGIARFRYLDKNPNPKDMN